MSRPATTDGGLAGTTVLLLDAEAKSGPTIVRQLGRHGVRVLVAATPKRPVPAQRSRYAARSLIHPHPLIDPPGLVDWLSRTIDETAPDCVVAQTDYTIRLLDKHRGGLASKTALALPPAEAIPTCYDKARLLALAESIGIDIPLTWRPGSLGEALDLADELPYPVYVKARESYWSGTETPRFARGHFAHGPDAFRRFYRELDELAPLPLVQDAVPGRVEGVCGVWRDGRPRSLFCYTETRTWPVAGGFGVFRDSIPLAEAPHREASALIEALRWTGVAQCEFIRDARDGSVRLLEVNGRFWGSTDFAHHCGADVAGDAVRIALGRPTPPATEYRAHAMSRWIEGDLKRLWVSWLHRDQLSAEVLRVPGRLETVWDLVAGFSPRVHQDDWYVDDPIPFLALFARTLVIAQRGADPGAPTVSSART